MPVGISSGFSPAMLAGVTTGFVLSVTLFPGAVWMAQLGWSGRIRQVWAAGMAFWLSQLFWMLIAAPGLLHMLSTLTFAHAVIHGFASFVLVYMAIKMYRAPHAESLQMRLDTNRVLPIFTSTMKQAVGMPMRLPAAMAVLVATGAFKHSPDEWLTVPVVLFGSLLGSAFWWGQLSVLAMFFERGLPEAVTLKSLNKIRRFSAIVFVCLAVMALAMLG